MGMHAEINAILNSFEPITLGELDSFKLLNRVDTKFLMSQRQLASALKSVCDEYRVLSISDMSLHRYRTLYFDTPTFTMYLNHHNGLGDRYKIRSRQYIDTGVSFLEVKHKTNKRRTIKRRKKTRGLVTAIDNDARQFLQEVYPDDTDLLEPKLNNSFTRITLASKVNTERLTLDLNLAFEVDGVRVGFPDVVVAEVKQERFSVHSDFFRQMRRLQVRTMGFSKYCTGVARMYPAIKQNLFKDRLLVVNKLSGIKS